LFLGRTHLQSIAYWRSNAMRSVIGGLVLVLAACAATGPADAKGCIKGAIVGGVAGHYAGHHAVLGAAAGCLAGRHLAKQHEKAMQNQNSAPNPAQ
jgi:outer membrane lipoprotein SlyB